MLLHARRLATRAVPMAHLSPHMRRGVVTKWHVAVGSRVQVGDLLYDVRVDQLAADGHAVDMEVEAHEDVFVARLLLGEGHEAAPNTPIALVVDHEEELPAARQDVVDEAKLAHIVDSTGYFMWQGYVRRSEDATAMCSPKTQG